MLFDLGLLFLICRIFVLFNGASVSRMVVRVPFLRWDIVKNPSNLSSRVALYYLETTQGQQVIAALAIRGEDNRLVYQPFGQFIEGYQDLLNLGHVAWWNYSFQTLC